MSQLSRQKPQKPIDIAKVTFEYENGIITQLSGEQAKIMARKFFTGIKAKDSASLDWQIKEKHGKMDSFGIGLRKFAKFLLGGESR